MTPKKGISVLGSTGSIGTQCLQIVESAPEKFQVISLAAGKNIAKIREQIKRFHPLVVSVANEEDAKTLRQEFPGVQIGSGEKSLNDCIAVDGVDVVVMGIMGFAALRPTLEAIRLNKSIALANKESLVVAGCLLKEVVGKTTAKIIPVDSEHNALYQLLAGRDRNEVRTLVLTASGGPLLKLPELPLDEVTPAIAIKHPNWSMGPKISVDSATLMNKGLELIEAHFLFDMPSQDIEVWVHPQSIVHGAVWLKDNTCLAQLSKPDMRSAIGYAMSPNERLNNVIPKLSLKEMSSLTFCEPDETRFPSLRLAREALQAGPSSLVALNAANEIAVETFLEGKMLFSRISATIEETLNRHTRSSITQVEDVFEQDLKAREMARAVASRFGLARSH